MQYNDTIFTRWKSLGLKKDGKKVKLVYTAQNWSDNLQFIQVHTRQGIIKDNFFFKGQVYNVYCKCKYFLKTITGTNYEYGTFNS